MNYEDLRRAWKEERESRKLQKLPIDFYKEVGIYANRIKGELKAADPESLRAKLLSAEFKRVEFLLSSLIKSRYGKLSRGLYEKQAEGIKEDELLKELDFGVGFKKLVSKVLSGRSEVAEEGPKKLVRFLKRAPPFMGIDMRKYGPFKANDLAYLPTKNVNILLKEGVVTEVIIDEGPKGN